MLIKHEIPLFEFDDAQSAVLEPNHEHFDMKLPRKCVVAFLYDETEVYAKRNTCKHVGDFVSQTKTFPVYTTMYEGEEIAFIQAPVGSSAAGQVVDWLIGYGVEMVLAIGSCGTLVEFKENEFLIPIKALRDEGTSYHYAKPSRYMELDQSMVEGIKDGLLGLNLPIKYVHTWTTDAFFRETKEKVQYRKEEGLEVVEMECSALAAVCKFRNVAFGEILYTADSLAKVNEYSERSFGESARMKAMNIAMHVIHTIK